MSPSRSVPPVAMEERNFTSVLSAFTGKGVHLCRRSGTPPPCCHGEGFYIRLHEMFSYVRLHGKTNHKETDVNVQQKPRQDEDSIGGLRPDAVLSNGAIESEEVNVDDEACIDSPDVVTCSKNETDGERGSKQ